MLRLSPLFAFLLIVGCSSVGGPGLDDQELPGNNNRPDGVTPKDDTVNQTRRMIVTMVRQTWMTQM